MIKQLSPAFTLYTLHNPPEKSPSEAIFLVHFKKKYYLCTENRKTFMKLTDISTAHDMGIELEIADGLQAGFPSPAQDHAGETIDLAREMVRHPESTFYARISGNSMIEAGIHDGDIVVIDRSLEAQNGNYVAACIDGEFTIKEYQFDAKNQCAWLIPHNKDFQKLKVTTDNQFCIWGVITHCVHKL